jgi:hypothetical protein
MCRSSTFRADFCTSLAVAALGLMLGLAATPLSAEEEELPLNFDVVAVNMSNVGPRGQVRLQIRVDRWSTDEERTKLIEALKAQTGRARDRTMADTLFAKESVGSIRESRSLAYDLRYARVIPSEAGRMIVLATDRRIDFAEAWRSTRTLDYNVSIIVLNLDEEGRGDGQIMLGAQLEWDETNDQLTITNFASEPIRLTRVRSR